MEKLNINLIVESTGKLIEICSLSKHLHAVARQVI